MHSDNQSRTATKHTTRLTPTLRKQLGLSAAANKDTITNLANRNSVCRKTVRNARDKTLAAVNNVFSQKQSDVLFHLPVTKKWIESLVLGLMFRKLEKLEPHRISAACTTLKNRKISSLN